MNFLFENMSRGIRSQTSKLIVHMDIKKKNLITYTLHYFSLASSMSIQYEILMEFDSSEILEK